MRPFIDDSAGAHAVKVPCLACGSMLPMHKAIIDLDGPSYQAYYHRECFPWPENRPLVITGKAPFIGAIEWYPNGKEV